MPKMHDNTTTADNKPKPPRSEAQKAAARRNGAKSKGPVTPEGKAASSRNALRHGLTAFHLALSSEDHESFNLVLADYMDEYRPVGPTETNLVERVAFAQWQMYRAWTAETAILNVEIETNRAKLDAKFTHFAEPVRVADAIESSLARTASLPHINRCLARINREYFQSLKMLRAIQKEETAETNPANDQAPAQPALGEAAVQNPDATAPETNPAADSSVPQPRQRQELALGLQSRVESESSMKWTPDNLTNPTAKAVPGLQATDGQKNRVAETNPAADASALVSAVHDHDNGKNSPSEFDPEWNRRAA